ncbi:helix-turn-helix domain-containing protein [Pseudofrankia inefficax]|uniref:helix-turn-helix domain-containing protein n=1 Tax=Pseudofrankia inefficax (strain DSM 45817 / CECT 9037 / DDB 130130 / EuI1c) TaxID=298654 RepID=UPI0012FD9F31|nr:helix-turn-helix transcriptional regulator [Pseudofrankia inefficax]
MTAADDDSRTRLVRRVRELTRARGMTLVQLADAASYTSRYLTDVLSGRSVPSVKVVATLERVLAAGGELVALREQAAREQVARRHGLSIPEQTFPAAPRAGSSGAVDVWSPDGAVWTKGPGEEADVDQDRREFLSLAAIVALAGQVSDDIATADPTPRTLDRMEADADELSAQIYDLPTPVLLGRAASQWHAAHVLLDRPVSAPVRARLLMVAGAVSCRAAFLGRRTGDLTIQRHFGVLAGQYADESGDPLLIGQVAGLRSRTAFSAKQYAKAAALAAAGLNTAHPTQRARLAAYQAEALAAAGRAGEARTALDTMYAESRRTTFRWTTGDQLIFGAVTLSTLGEHRPAADLADAYITGGEFDGEGVGWAHVTIGQALFAADRPDPAAAAHHGRLALAATPDADLSVITRVADLHTHLRQAAAGDSEVAELGQALAGARASLTA